MEENEVFCNVDKRRKCDSAYKTLYNKLLKKYNNLQFEYDNLKKLLSIYRELLENLKGGEYDGKR